MLAVVRGSGEIGLVVALTVFRSGNRVVLHDSPRPSHARRGVAFTDALFSGRATLDGVMAKYARTLEEIPHMLVCGRAIAVCDHAFEPIVAVLQPDVLVDARMRKRVLSEAQRGLARLTIGLGPNFVAGATTDIVIETAHGRTPDPSSHPALPQRLPASPSFWGDTGATVSCMPRLRERSALCSI